MKPKYFAGTGEPPIHVSYIDVGRFPKITFRGGGKTESKVEFDSEEGFIALLLDLQQQRVPFSVGGYCPGPADALVMSLQQKGFGTSFVQISWHGPNHWEVREMNEEAKEWQEASSLEEIANTSFHPTPQTTRRG